MRLDGTVKFFNHTRGFGFIMPDNGVKRRPSKTGRRR
jgi:cold shock CspA family protein